MVACNGVPSLDLLDKDPRDLGEEQSSTQVAPSTPDMHQATPEAAREALRGDPPPSDGPG